MTHHYHIRWSGGALDWQAFDTVEEAQLLAAQIKRPQETFAIEEFNWECPPCRAMQTRAVGHALGKVEAS